MLEKLAKKGFGNGGCAEKLTISGVAILVILSIIMSLSYRSESVVNAADTALPPRTSTPILLPTSTPTPRLFCSPLSEIMNEFENFTINGTPVDSSSVVCGEQKTLTP